MIRLAKHKFRRQEVGTNMPTVPEVGDTATHWHSILHLCCTWCSVWSCLSGYCETITTLKWFHVPIDMCGPFHTLAGSNSNSRYHGWDSCLVGCSIWSSLRHHNWWRRTVPISSLAAFSTVPKNLMDPENCLPSHWKWFGRMFQSPIKDSSNMSVYPKKKEKFATNCIIRHTHGT